MAAANGYEAKLHRKQIEGLEGQIEGWKVVANRYEAKLKELWQTRAKEHEDYRKLERAQKKTVLRN